MKLSEVAHLVFHPAMLRGAPRELVISDLSMEYVSWAEEPVPVLHFRDELLTLPLRDWNASALVSAFGDDSRAFRGRSVKLSVDSINGFEFVALAPVRNQSKMAHPAARRKAPKRRSR